MKTKILFLLFFLCVTFYSNAQNQGLYVNAHLKILRENFEEASLTLEDDSTEEKKIIEGTYDKKRERKNFQVILPFNHNFTFTFAKPNYRAKQVLFDTHVPTLREKQDNLDSVEFALTLFFLIDSTEVYNKVAAKYKYSDKSNDFNK